MLKQIKHYVYHVPTQAIADVFHKAGLTKRSSRWPTVRKAWLKNHPACAACGGVHCVQVHHKEPFHLHPEKELDMNNFITLCECSPGDDHLRIGHLGDWKSFNPHVEADAALMLKRAHDHVGAQAG
jgi:hypothetical protein